MQHTQDNKFELQCWKTTFDLFQLTGTLVSNHTEHVRVITNIFENEKKELKRQSPEQEKLLHPLEKHELSKSNIIQAKNIHGQSVSLGVLRRVEIDSSSVSKSAVCYQSQQTEAFQLVSLVCSKSSKDSVA